MWTRYELKERAKAVLRTSYWKAFLVSLLLAVITGGLPSCSYRYSGGGGGGGHVAGVSGEMGIGDAAWAAIIVIAIIIIVIAVLVGLALRIFLISPLEVGVRKYFIQSAQQEVNLNHLGFSFARGRYGEVVKGMLWMMFLNILWFLLLIIPGIVKSYSYSLVPYLLADNPGIGMKRAVSLSDRMTRGHKWRMFVLDLSFIGWFLLGTIALFVGTLFVLPYYNATKAELYLVLRDEALKEGFSSRMELNLPVLE
ncbi:DUF975 family protein [Paenibacillus sp. HJGM_3]|uniref:DUF975 family protein n=1 Tax=Paenibacillus sp. HJGM_3 TaxID=3379816 RepID=UPI00385D6461